MENSAAFTFGTRDLIILVQFAFILWILYFRERYQEWVKLQKIKRSGDYGEKLVGEYLDELEDVFCIFHGLLGKFDNQIYEIDHLLLTHQGLVLIETKNIRGTITQKKDGSWSQVKKSESGKAYERDFRSPVQQIERTIRIFENFLKSKGFFVKIYPVIVFSSREVNLKKLPDQKFPVIHLHEVEELISQLSSDVPLRTRQLRELKDLLDHSFEKTGTV